MPSRLPTTTRPLAPPIHKFTLPPRALADQLMDRYWERMYCLYPFFHKPTFMRAYESLWKPQLPRGAAATDPSLPNLGLGSSPGADDTTIVFHCALNIMLAIGAQFSDLDPDEKTALTGTFFYRAKAFIGLDLLEMNNMGVVQVFLLTVLFVQSTPSAFQCWNAVGVACRVAQGLGLHTESSRTVRSPLETDIRRRTWHGCVILDMSVPSLFFPHLLQLTTTCAPGLSV